MKNNFFTFMENTLMGPMSKLANQKHLKAVRNSMISTIPFTIVGSFFLLLAFPPLKKEFLESISYSKNFGADFSLVFKLSVGVLSLIIAFNTAYYLAKSYDLDGISAATLSIIAFMITQIPTFVKVADDTTVNDWFLSMRYLGSGGIFGAILVAFFSVETIRFFQKKRLVIKMPDGVPGAVGRSFEALFPTIFVIVVVYIISIGIKFNIHSFLYEVFKPMIIMVNHPIGVFIIIILVTFLWACGIHGVSIIGTIARPVWNILLEQNGEALKAGETILPNIAPEPFYQWFVWIGGSGCTIGLLLLMVFSKSKQLKSLGRMAFLPGIFNINEPIIFGTPIMLNPFLIIPFMLAPLVTAAVSYFVLAENLVSRISVLAPWTFPGPIGAYIATNGDYRAIILVIINIIISIIIYFPFFKLYEKKLLLTETEGDNEEVKTDNTDD